MKAREREAMKILRNERGVALITSLLLMLISLAIVMALLYMINQGIRSSAAAKNYKNALDASYGGAEVVTKQVIPQLLSGSLPTFLSTAVANSDCLSKKLLNAPSGWDTACGAPGTPARTLDPTNVPDVTFLLKSQDNQPDFKVYAKIVDTNPGNSDPSGFTLLDSGSGVTGTGSGVSPMHIPALYRIEIQGQRTTNPVERAALSVLYAY
jgi:hypothetical protein